jgi:hypothetical protein
MHPCTQHHIAPVDPLSAPSSKCGPDPVLYVPAGQALHAAEPMAPAGRISDSGGQHIREHELHAEGKDGISRALQIESVKKEPS